MVLRVIREKDSYLKLYRRLEMTVNNIKMSTPSTIKQGDDLRRQLRAIKNDEVYYRKEMNRVRQIIDMHTLEYLKEEKVEREEYEEWEAQMEVNKELEQQLEKNQHAVNESAKKVEEIKMERDLKVMACFFIFNSLAKYSE